ncbi:PREDICTED: microtubule-associated protein futsch isoform X2 [Trachymyrmex septentrionalis]|uniref:microtubule-associated protein futsch isoform X2 n=1 Tax=Trachymyrmex septentrionalis TaxID=34720 RepID=UPI00084F10BC|nr:PREDICTED: microtubule-associated protein futsch isoform X2 [Trachymyrmex septentrionalis]
MEPEQRGRTSRASSTSSLGREVRCGCQFYRSDSLLPERRALLVRPSSRTMQQPPAVRCSEHDYEPIAPPPPSLPHPAMAPVVRITDTDVMPVADSDDSIDDRSRLPPELILDGDVILPLDGKIEDSAMEGRELGETGGDTSEELEPTAQQFQDRLEERFLASTPYTESRTDGEVNTSQIDSSVVEELPLRRGARGLPQRLKTQASKLRSRLRGFQRPTFSFPQKRQKPEKATTTTTTTTTTTARSAAASSGKSDKSRKSVEKRPSRIDRIRTSISEKTEKFNLERPRFSLPDRSKFHLPERPKFSLPDKSRFHLPDKSKFNIKKPNIRLPSALARVKRPPPLREQQQQHSTESTAGSKRNIFDFATYPRIFDKKSKKRGEYATSSPKDSRTQSAESATFPRTRKTKSFGTRWAQRFGDSAYVQDQDRPEEAAGSEGSPPWHQSSMEEPPRLSAGTEEEIMAAAHAIPWEDTKKREQYEEEEIQYMDYEQESSEMSDRHPAPPKRSYKSRRWEESYEHEEVMEVDPKLYDQEMKHVHRDDTEENEDAAVQDDWHAEQQMMHKEKFRPILKSRSLDEDMPRVLEQERYGGAFMAMDPRRFGLRKMASEEEEGEEEHEPSSIQSDREQQASSGSSCDRRRRGVIEEIDSDEFFLRQSGISQDDMNLGNYLTDEIRDALRAEVINALQDDELPSTPPQRPVRTRTLRKHKADLAESNEAVPPVRPKRERSAAARHSREASIEMFRERTRSDSRSDSRHRVVYQTEGEQPEPLQEPLDDIVVVKPVRRKSRSSLRSHSQPPMETSILSPSTPITAVLDSPATLSTVPPIVPIRRKRSHRETMMDRRNGDVSAPICNGHRDDWEIEIIESRKPIIPARSSRSRQSLTERFANGDVVMSASHEDIENLDARLQRQDTVPEPLPIPPKRRSRSRTMSVVDEDRTSHGAESLPEAGYVEEDIPREEEENSSARDISGYAIVEKREKPPRPPPPRRKRDKFATTPRPTPPKRPQRAYSTLRPTTIRDVSTTSDTIISMTLIPSESAPYIEVDVDEVEHKDFRSGELLDKIQGRPLPAPPRPPRIRKEHAMAGRPRTPFEYEETMETTAATQTDPLPDDMVIEELEITQAKLIMTPSRSGSQIMVSMEHIPSPSRTTTPPVPPLPILQFLRKEEEEEEEEEKGEEGEEERLPKEEDIRMAYETASLTSPSPTREIDFREESKHRSAPHLEEHVTEESQSRPQIRSSFLSDEPLRISSLEVGDLKVDRLSVSQIEAHKIVASEVDAMMITASKLRGGDSMEESLSPAIIRELIAIRSHLETVMTTQAQERYRESEKESASHKITDIPIKANSPVQERQPASQDVPTEAAKPSETVVNEPTSTEDEKTDAGEDKKVVTNVVDVRDKEISHPLSVVQAKEFPSPQTLTIDELEFKGKESTTHLFTVAQDKSLRILDSEHPLTLSPRTTSGSHVDESRASYPPSDTPSTRPSESREYPPSDAPSTQPSELRESPDRVGESPSISVQTTTTTITTTTTTTTELGAMSTDLRSSKNDVSDNKEEQTPRKSRSRSSSPTKGITRQTASPVRSLPPAISVTPDTSTPDSTVPRHGGISADAKPQRAVISYSSDTRHDVPKDSQPQRAVISQSSDVGQSLTEKQRESSQSPVSSFPLSSTHFIAFPASEIPAQFFSLSETPTNQRSDIEPGVIDTTQQLLRALRLAGIKAMRYFIGYLASTLSMDDSREKIRDVELTICALLLLIAGLLIYYFSSTRIVTHHHHWDYFNPPQ